MEDYIDPVFGPDLAGPRQGNRENAERIARQIIPLRPPPAVASMLVNVTFRVSLAGEPATLTDPALADYAREVMAGAVHRELDGIPGASLDGGVAVTAQVTRG